MKITIGEYEVYETGSLIAVENKPVEFFFPNFSVKIEFEDSEENKENKKSKDSQIYYSLEDETQRLTVKLVNFNNPLGTEGTEPAELGKINGRKLFFQFRVYAMDNGDNKVLHYTWLLGKEEQNG